jgi:hypothetical protein
MTARATGWRLLAVAVAAAAVLAALTLVPVAAADKAGDAYQADIAKAKQKRAAALDRCKAKPTKAKRNACRSNATANFQKAKQKAKAKRDKARERAGGEGGGPQSPAEQRQEVMDCVRDGGRPSECHAEGRGKP